jgi:S1-C subfamily serine protease
MNIIKTDNLNKQARTFMPEIIAPGTGLSPVTDKSVIPTNNVITIQDALNGQKYWIPGGGGDWSSGEDSFKSYKDDGFNYKREERDMSILNNMMKEMAHPNQHEIWTVYVPGGSRTFESQSLANSFKNKQLEKGIRVTKMIRKVIAQNNKIPREQVISDSLSKTFMVEAIDMQNAIKLNGAAFCISPSYFITCAHVIKEYNKNEESPLNLNEIKSQVSISLINGNQKYKAELINVDSKNDIAILKSNISCEIFEFEELVNIGDNILTVGSPHGYENNVSFGSIGSLNRKIYTYKGAPDFMFVDLSAFTGNSGGPIINEESGKVVGMLTSIVTTNSEYGLSSALPARYIINFCKNNNILEENKKYK